MQLGFVIDHARCIGCHACTVACKAENEVPVGSFRTWVKYVEHGAFPQVRRSFAVLRCNQCTNPPCVTICPVRALEKRPDGVVDVDPRACIGCKSCLQACPYDALYVHPETGTAEKCHFCAHRTEVGLAPACAVVCPTEAIVPGDLDDPRSRVARLRAEGGLVARRTEAGTGPNVFYREADPVGLDPAASSGAGGYLWADRLPSPQLDAQTHEAFERRAAARTTYDVDHPPAWGWKVSTYLFTKSIAAGLFVASHLLHPILEPGAVLGRRGQTIVVSLALAFLGLTTALLVADLRRPARFLKILLRPNWDSWLVRGALILGAYGALLVAWLFLLRSGAQPGRILRWSLDYATLALALLAAAYTAWLFGQARGRPLWMLAGQGVHLVAQAGVAGVAFLLLVAPWLGPPPEHLQGHRLWLCVFLVFHAAWGEVKHRLGAPAGREDEVRRAVRLITHGPFARRHRVVALGLGVAVPLVLLVLLPLPGLTTLAGALALVGLWVEEDTYVRAGQALPIH
jgi:Fe-S-cluster-containing dehydrogenase component/formate-dependent nitrite reductase membrane component NrfD